MLLVRDESLSACCELVVNNTFILGNHVYVIGNLEADTWKMYTISTDSFAVKEVQTNTDVFDFDDCDYREAAIVYNGVAYMWQGSDMVAGREERGAFVWRRIVTSGPKPRFNSMTSVGFFDGDKAKYVVLVQDDYSLSEEEVDEGEEDGIYYKCTLDLDTMHWTREETIKEETDCLNDFTTHRLLATRAHFHTIWDQSSVDSGEHHTLNPASNEWTLITNSDRHYADPKSTVFVVRDNLYKLGCTKKGSGNVMMVKRWIQDDTWEKVAEWPSPKLSVFSRHVVVEKSRIFVLVLDTRRHSLDKDRLARVMVLDMDPSLNDLSLAAVLRNKNLKDFAVQELNLGFLLLRDSVGDSLIPAFD